MELGLEHKVALVTGGSSGIGLAVVRTLLAEGARVSVVDREACPVAGVPTTRGDLADAETARRAVQEVVERFARLDLLLNNAGRNDGVGLDAGPAAFAASLQQNLVHVYAVVHCAREHLRRGPGAIVNIASKVAFTGQGSTSGYAASKGGVLALTREWALELAPHGVRVNAVVPAEVATPLYDAWLASCPDPAAERARIERSIPLGARFTTADEIAATAVFLLSPRSSHTTGQVVFVDGGYTHLDRRATSG